MTVESRSWGGAVVQRRLSSADEEAAGEGVNAPAGREGGVKLQGADKHVLQLRIRRARS